MRSLKDCEYSVFISYAHADDEAWFNWVSDFAKELKNGMSARLRGVDVPPVHLSGANGPVSGLLADELQRKVAASFAMVIVVHENYAASDWCLKEIELFRALFGEEGFRQRLYIVAMSRPWMEAVKRKPQWNSVFPSEDQVWAPFFQKANPDMPIEIYLGKELVSPDFKEPFLPLCLDLVGKIKEDLARPAGSRPVTAALPSVSIMRPSVTGGTMAPPPSPPSASAPSPVTQMPVTAVHTTAPPAGVLFGVTTPELGSTVQALVESLRRDGVPAEMLGMDAMLSGFAAFEGARTLILPFNDSQPLLPYLPGGHLAMQRDAWGKRGLPAQSLVWLDLRHAAPAPAPAGREHAAFIESVAGDAIGPDALPQRLGIVKAPPPPDSVRIYIESNQHEIKLWERLGEQIEDKWDEITGAEGLDAPQLYVRTRGLPVDQIDQIANLDDADGVVLLWGRKTPEALVAQINKVEGKLTGRHVAPGIVAYLMPPQADDGQPIPAWGWKVLRFQSPSQDEVSVVREEADELADFLRKVLKRTTQRRKAQSGRTVGPTTRY